MTNTFESTLPIQALFENPTIAQLAEQIEDYQGVQKVDRAPIEALPRHSVPFGYDELPLSYAQQRLWFLDQLLLSAYAQQDIPFEHLVSELVDERNLSHPPLIQVMFELQDAFFAPKGLAGLSLEQLNLENITEKLYYNIIINNTYYNIMYLILKYIIILEIDDSIYN